MDAEAVLTALHQAGLPVTGLTLRDLADPMTWAFQPATLTKADVAQATVLVQTLIDRDLHPPPVVVAPTLDQVIAWTAGKLLVPEDVARPAILALPPVYVPPTKGT